MEAFRCNFIYAQITVINFERSGIGDVSDPEVFGNLRGHLGGVPIYRLHAADDDVIVIAFEKLRFDFLDCPGQRISGGRSIGAAQFSICEQNAGIGADGHSVAQDILGEGRAHRQADHLTLGLFPHRQGKSQRLLVQLIADIIEQSPL